MHDIENKRDILSDEKNVLRKAVNQKKSCVNGETTGVFNAVSESAMHDNMLYRFRARQGHGYAAEQGNDLIDKINLKDAKILGNDNKKWGPDRLVDGKSIQTKYCENARASVDAAFDKGSGLYKYTLENGKPMQLEVPNEQYEEAVRIMGKRIAEGKVPHTKNPKDAKKLVRKGNVTYNQAKAIAKAGTVESLVFDAAHGAVIGMSAAGISATITFAKALWDGQDTEIAVEVAMYEGIKMGGMAFASSVLAAQLTRTPFNQMLMGPTIELVKLLPSSVRNALVNSLRGSAPIYGGAATNNLAKLLRGNIIAMTCMVLVMSAENITLFFQGKISGKQLFKDVSVLVAGIGGGMAGGAVMALAGAAIGGPVGAAVGGYVGIAAGGIAGGTLSGAGAQKILDHFVEDDAVEMVRILNKAIVPLVQEYLLSEEELNLVLEDLKQALIRGKLLLMYASDDRRQFADDMIIQIIQNIVCWRSRISLPEDKEFLRGMGNVMTYMERGENLEVKYRQDRVNAETLAQDLMGRKVSKDAADKAWYVTKQMNLQGKQQEYALLFMQNDEKIYAERKERSEKRLRDYKMMLEKIMEEQQMTKELDIVRADILSPEESRVLDAELDRIIHKHKGNRKEINKLVFESIACMTEADEAQTALSSKGFFKRLWGGFSGDNSRLQNKINENRAAAQYASQRTLQKLAEQNLMTFDLIAAVNHKLNASLNRVNDEFAYIYEGLLRFFKYNRNELVKLETRIDKLEQNVNLLTWQNSIEYQDLDGVEYTELDTAGKMVCLTRDFYDITKGVWETKDLLLLKTAMSTVDLQPKEQVNYMSVLKTISDRPDLKEKLLQGKQLKQIEDPRYLISMGTLGKLESLKNEERYVVDTVENYLKDNQVPADKEEISVNLTYKYMAEKAQVNPNMDVNCYDMMLDLLYNLREAEENQLLVRSDTEKLLYGEDNKNLLEASETQTVEDIGEELLNKGNACYCKEEYNEIGEFVNYEEAFRYYQSSAESGNVKAQNNLGVCYFNGKGVKKDCAKAFSLFQTASERGDIVAKNNLGLCYYYGLGILLNQERAATLFHESADAGCKEAMMNLGNCYHRGNGIDRNIDIAIEWYKKSKNEKCEILKLKEGKCDEYDDLEPFEVEIAKRISDRLILGIVFSRYIDPQNIPVEDNQEIKNKLVNFIQNVDIDKDEIDSLVFLEGNARGVILKEKNSDVYYAFNCDRYSRAEVAIRTISVDQARKFISNSTEAIIE